MLAFGTLFVVAAIVCAIHGGADAFAYLAIALAALGGAYLLGGGIELSAKRHKVRGTS